MEMKLASRLKKKKLAAFQSIGNTQVKYNILLSVRHFTWNRSHRFHYFQQSTPFL